MRRLGPDAPGVTVSQVNKKTPALSAARPIDAHVLLLTGVPGVGKTTVIRRLAEQLGHRRIGGFYTAEIREDGVRRGFRLVAFGGGERVIAHVDFPPPRVSKYGIDVAALDAGAGMALAVRADRDVYIVDEIGKMECLSPRFVESMRRLLDNDGPVIATIARHGGGLIAEAKRRPDGVLWEVTRANRDGLPNAIRQWLEARGATRRDIRR